MCVHSQHKNTRHHQSRRQCKVRCQYQWLLLCLYLHKCRSALNKYCTAPVLYRYRGPCTVNLEHLGLSAKIPPCYGFVDDIVFYLRRSPIQSIAWPLLQVLACRNRRLPTNCVINLLRNRLFTSSG